MRKSARHFKITIEADGPLAATGILEHVAAVINSMPTPKPGYHTTYPFTRRSSVGPKIVARAKVVVFRGPRQFALAPKPLITPAAIPKRKPLTKPQPAVVP